MSSIPPDFSDVLKQLGSLNLMDRSLENLHAAEPLIDELFRMLGHENIADVMYHGVETRLIDLESAAAVIDQAFWMGSSNGAECQRALEGWLIDNTSEEKARLALSTETYFFRSRERMEEVLKEVASRHPSLRARCFSLMEKRRAQGV